MKEIKSIALPVDCDFDLLRLVEFDNGFYDIYLSKGPFDVFGDRIWHGKNSTVADFTFNRFYAFFSNPYDTDFVDEVGDYE